VPGINKGLGVAALIAATLTAFGAGAYFAGLHNSGQYKRFPAYQANVRTVDRPNATQIDTAVAEVKRIPCQSLRSENESSLCAQWKATQAAGESADWAFWQFVLTTLSVMGLGATLWFNLKAWQSAGDANKIAKDAQRPWITAKIVPLCIGPCDTGHIEIAFDLTIKNDGGSAATGLRISQFSVHSSGAAAQSIEANTGTYIDDMVDALPPNSCDTRVCTTSFPTPDYSAEWTRYQAIIIVEILYEGGKTRETWLVGEKQGERIMDIRHDSQLVEADIGIKPHRYRVYE
jgi:hypothetical protein